MKAVDYPKNFEAQILKLMREGAALDMLDTAVTRLRKSPSQKAAGLSRHCRDILEGVAGRDARLAAAAMPV